MANVVITGGSRGIGAAAVRLFAARGDRVWFLYAGNHAAAETVARETGAVAIQCDVADAAAVQAAFSQIPGVDILICSAGIAHYGLISQITEAEWDRLFAVNTANGVQMVLHQGVYLTQNTSQAASVEYVRLRRTYSARSRLQYSVGKPRRGFSTVREGRWNYLLLLLVRCSE